MAQEGNKYTKDTEEDKYTKDGTVDYLGNPANKKETGTWRACTFIIGNEFCERLAYYGMNSNLVLYFKNILNQSSATATKNNSEWIGTCYITPLIGAFLADAYLGRYWTIAIFMTIYVIGMTLLAMSASVPGLKPKCYAKNDCDPTDAQNAVCFVALYLVALGAGGIKPCVSSYGADQFDDTDEVEKKHKGSYFNWFYFSLNVGDLIASSVLVYVQDNWSWGWGFGIPAIAMAIAVTSFFLGTQLYRNQKPGGSPLIRLFQVIVASIRKYNVKVPADKALLYETADAEYSNIKGSRKVEHTSDFSFFDKAAVETEKYHFRDSVNPWTLSTVTQVEELKSIIRLLPVWATGIIFAAVCSQMSNLFVLQGDKMNKYVGNSNFKIPSASLSVFNSLSVILWVPIYDRIIVSYAKKYTGYKNGLTQLQRIGIGFIISVFAMVSAAVLEMIRLGLVRRHNYYQVKEVPISVFWQVPQYFLIGCAEVFTSIGQLEFFYQEAPDAMRSMCSALSLTKVALGNYLSSLLVTITTSFTAENEKRGWIPDNLNYGHIDYFFWVLTVLSGLNLGAFLLISKWYTYKTPLGTLR